MTRPRRWLLAFGAAALLVAVDAFVVEPRLLLGRDEVKLDVGVAPLRIAHLSDLHLRSADSYLARKLVREVRAARPDVVLVSGDWVDDVRERRGLVAHAREAAALAGELRRVAPVMAVQGHSDYLGELVAILASSGVTWLSNEGRRVGRGDGVLVLGLNQQVGHDAGEAPPPFAPLTARGRVGARAAAGRTRQREPLPELRSLAAFARRRRRPARLARVRGQRRGVERRRYGRGAGDPQPLRPRRGSLPAAGRWRRHGPATAAAASGW